MVLQTKSIDLDAIDTRIVVETVQHENGTVAIHVRAQLLGTLQCGLAIIEGETAYSCMPNGFKNLRSNT